MLFSFFRFGLIINFNKSTYQIYILEWNGLILLWGFHLRKVFANNYSYDQNMPKDFRYQIDIWIDILNQIDINYHNFKYLTWSFQRSVQLIKYFKAKPTASWTVRWKVIIWLCIELFEETLSCCYWKSGNRKIWKFENLEILIYTMEILFAIF